MTGNSKNAWGTVERRLKSLDVHLTTAGHSAEERDVILAGLREHISDEIDASNDASALNIEGRLDEMIGDLELPPGDPAHLKSDDQSLALAAFLVSIGVSGAIAIGSPIATALGADGGAVMILIALIGYPIAFALGWLSRSAPFGRAALVISAIGAVILTALVGAAFLLPES